MNNIDIVKVANNISNYTYQDNLEATKQLMELLDSISGWPLHNWKDYVKMYDDSFYTYHTWEELVASEAEQSDGFTEQECEELMNRSIWKLPCGWYVQYV